jgi:magnesium chelatase family protein
MLIASMNPCPCGFYNHPDKKCTCPAGAVQKYLNKISGPLLDRIDLHVEVTPVAFNELSNQRAVEPSACIRERVIRARLIQEQRFNLFEGTHANAQMSSKLLQQICVLDSGCQTDTRMPWKIKTCPRRLRPDTEGLPDYCDLQR